jgi:DNA-binding transcriptional LysR family regulator
VVLGGDEACEVRLRVSETLGALCLPPVLGRLREVHPAARVQVTTASREGVAADLRRGNVDVALVLGEPFAAPGVTVETLGREELVVCTVPGGPLSGLGEAGPDDLADAPLVLTRRVWSARPLMERALAGCGEGMAGGVECSSAAIVRRCVLAGLGVSVLPRFFVAEDARRGRITIVPWRGEALFATVFAARDRVRTPPAPGRPFLRLTREFFAARDAMRLTENRH